MARRATPSRLPLPTPRSEGRASRAKAVVAGGPPGSGLPANQRPKPSAKRRPEPGPGASRRKGRTRGPFSVLVLSGPNLQLLGTREPQIYGKETLVEIHARLAHLAGERAASVDCRQSNHEGDLLDWLGSAPSQGFAGVLINGGAFTHTSLAIYDAIRAIGLPVVEVHLSNPEAREAYRKESKLAPACVGKVVGFGASSYLLALRGLLDLLDAKR